MAMVIESTWRMTIMRMTNMIMIVMMIIMIMVVMTCVNASQVVTDNNTLVMIVMIL